MVLEKKGAGNDRLSSDAGMGAWSVPAQSIYRIAPHDATDIPTSGKKTVIEGIREDKQAFR